ncbi:MAG: hypothetical protein AB2A00_30070 [Myxococcota bacterium]
MRAAWAGALLGLCVVVATCATSETAVGGPGGGGERFDLDRSLWRPGTVAEWGLGRSILVASGLRDLHELAEYEKKLDRTIMRILDAARADPSGLPLYLRIHHAMHTQALKKGYQLRASSMTRVLDEGAFNCLSGTGLYVLTAQRAGLVVSAYGMRGHILALVFDADGAHHVETTFKEQSDPAVRQMVGLEESSLIPEELKNTTFDVSPEELVAMFYWNRAADAAERHDFWDNQVSMLSYVSLGPTRPAGRHVVEKRDFFRAALQNQCDRDGCRRCVDLMDNWLRPERLGASAQKPVVRDLRAECFERWYMTAPSTARCDVIYRAVRTDAQHPRLAPWAESRELQECNWKR